MRYALLINPHANVRYRSSLEKLACIELECLLQGSAAAHTPAETVQISGEPFLVFKSETLNETQWQLISRHSAICFAAEYRPDGTLLPIARTRPQVLSEDLPQVLKYKGKTNADFTAMLLHCAYAALKKKDGPITVLDPMCGKATTLFCGLVEGMNAIGIDMDRKSIAEADQYLTRSLQMHRVHYTRSESSRTLRGGGQAKETAFSVQAGKDTALLSCRMLIGDAGRANEILKPNSCQLIISDMPYGVQHAPGESGRMSTLEDLAKRAAEACLAPAVHGAVLGWSFNENTLKRDRLEKILEKAGWNVITAAPYNDLRHWVEQAVDRDAVFAMKP